MTSNDDGAARSRRERPAKPALTRQGIVDAALVILGEEGLSKVTMRRIAAALDTGPASLYVYVRNTEDLHAQILDTLLGPVAASARESADTAGAGNWRERLKALLTSYRDVLFAHPEIARMAMSTQPSGPNYLTLLDAVLALLRTGGVADEAAALGVDLLLLYPTAIAVEHTGPKSPAEKAAEYSALTEQVAAVDPARYPQVARLGRQLMAGDGQTRSDFAFDVLLDGIFAVSVRIPDHNTPTPDNS